MVTRLKDNLEYIKYIRNNLKESFPEWEEYGETRFTNEVNNNFQISFIANVFGFTDSTYKVSFVKDRGLLELDIYDKNGSLINLGYLLYNGIIKQIPNQDGKWVLSLCTELIDFYINFLDSFYTKHKMID